MRSTSVQIMAYTLVLTAVTLVLGPIAHLGALYDLAALALGLGFFAYSYRLYKTESPKVAMRVFSYSITYLMLLFIAMGVDVVVHHG